MIAKESGQAALLVNGDELAPASPEWRPHVGAWATSRPSVLKSEDFLHSPACPLAYYLLEE
jgi:hypothetical protein